MRVYLWKGATMRDPIDEAFREWEKGQRQYESRCPVCVVCGEPIMTEHFYEIDGEPVCDDINCIKDYLSQYRRNVAIWIENQEV